MDVDVTGTFTVSASFEPPYSEVEGVSLGRATFTKRFDGPLAAASTVQFLACRGPDPSSAGYVAIERIEGELLGRAGSFVAAHLGLVDAGQQSLRVAIVPGSGTGALAGLTGEMEIRVEGGVHHYRVVGRLPG